MSNKTLEQIASWLFSSLSDNEVDTMEVGSEAFSIALAACQFEKEYRFNEWQFNSRYFNR